jgi:hypothetical protein
MSLGVVQVPSSSGLPAFSAGDPTTSGICNDVQTFVDSEVLEDVSDRKPIDFSIKKYTAIPLPYDSDSHLFTTVKLSGVSADIAKYKTITCVIED